MTELTSLTKELDLPWFESYLYTERGGGGGGGSGEGTVAGRNHKRMKASLGDKFITRAKKVLLLKIRPQPYYQLPDASPDKSSKSPENPLKLECFLATVFDGRHTLTCLFYPSTLSEGNSFIKTPVLLKLIKHKPKLFKIPSTLFSSSKIISSLNLRSPAVSIACFLVVKKAQVMDSIPLTEETDGNQIASMFLGKPWISRNIDVLELWKDDVTDFGLIDPSLFSHLNSNSPANSTELDPPSISHPPPPTQNEDTFPPSFWVIPPDQLQQIHHLLATLPGWSDSSHSNLLQPTVLPTSSLKNTVNSFPSPPAHSIITNPISPPANPSTQTTLRPTTPADFLSDAISLWEEELEDLAILLS